MLFITALLFICFAHVFRVLRWELFIKTYEKPDRAILFRSLCVAYVFNAFLPMKMGDLLRAEMAGRRMKNGRGFSLATVIIERYLDIVVVGFVFVLLWALGGDNYSRTSLIFYVIVASSVLLFSTAVFAFKSYAKKIVVKTASLFNERIEFLLLRFSWSLICSFKDVLTRIRKRKLLFLTVSMWALYFGSYFCFSEALKSVGVETTWQYVFYTLFAENSVYMGNLSTFVADYAAKNSVILSATYIILPSLFLLILSFVIRHSDNGVVDDTQTYLNLLPHLDEQERLNFLELYFSGENREYIENYLSLNRNIEIIRDFSAGSNATTMLCRRGDTKFFRKYAFGKDGEKLWKQVEWLRDNEARLPLTEIIYAEHSNNYCYYDMPYLEDAVSAYEFSHSMPVNMTWKVIRNVLNTLETSVYTVNRRKADNASVEEYIVSKVSKNIEKIMNADGELKELMRYDELVINGKQYKNLSAFFDRLDGENLKRIFASDDYSVIHGDLTIENIICRKNGGPYIIDPNTGNIHESPNLDYAKLLQSIHGGYEFLMAQKELAINGNEISFPFMRSAVYESLYSEFDCYMRENFDMERIRSIYYHEIIHWLRLMPYKIEKNGKRAVLFYAGMIMVMNDIFERFSDD